MADTSSRSIEESFVASVWVQERQHTWQTMSQVMAAFRDRFNKAPPRRSTLLDSEKRAFALRSVKERPRSGRKTTCLETCSNCHFHWTFRNEIDTETIVRAWCAVGNNAIPHEEGLECEAVSPNLCEWTVGWRHGTALWFVPCSAGHILKCHIPHKGSFQWRLCHLSQCARQNMVFWSKENPNFTQELEHNPQHVMIWAGMTSDYLIGPYFSMDRWMRHLIRQCWRRGSYHSWETEDSWMTCGCSTMGHTSLFLCAMFWTNVFQAARLAVAHRHLRHHCHDHHVVLTLPHQTIRCGVLSREEWLRVATTTTKISAELWKTPFAQLLPKCSDVCHRGHGGVCPASRCTYGFAGHVTKAYVSDSNQIMVAYSSVYGDFSPTL